VAANLAASLARSGEDVCLVCADVFGTTAVALLGEVPDVGLAEVLAGEQPVDRALRPVVGIPTLRVLGPGRDPDRADALLQTRSARVLFNQLRETVTYVVVESAPTSEGIAAQTLAGAADAAVLVVEAGGSTVRDVVDALGQLDAMQRPVLGAVVVRAEPEQSSTPAVQRPRPPGTREQDELPPRDRVAAGPPPGSTGSALP
jgi:Mrp family chromosome partitioning ATPase